MSGVEAVAALTWCCCGICIWTGSYQNCWISCWRVFHALLLTTQILLDFVLYRALQYLNTKDIGMQEAVELQIREYGRTPDQLFKKKHKRQLKGQKRSLSSILLSCLCGGDLYRSVDGATPAKHTRKEKRD